MEENKEPRISFFSRPLTIRKQGLYILIVLVCFIGIYALFNRNGFVNNLYKIGALSCVDVDKNDKESGVYTSSKVKGWDVGRASIVELKDTCSTGILINEAVCNDGVVSYIAPAEKCLNGCYNGRCLEKNEAFQEKYRSDFEAPYTISWDQETNPQSGVYQSNTSAARGHFDLKGVALGDILITNEFTPFSYQEYKIGQVIPVLVFQVRMTALTNACFDIVARSLDPKTGDMRPSLSKQFVFGGSPYNECATQANTSYDKRIIFPVDENEREFYVSTGDSFTPVIKISLGQENQISTEVIRDVQTLSFLSDENKKALFPYKVRWTVPKTDPITIKRGAPLEFQWQIGGVPKNEPIVFMLDSTTCDIMGFEGKNPCDNRQISFDISDLKGSAVLDVSPGEYVLRQISPISVSNGQSVRVTITTP